MDSDRVLRLGESHQWQPCSSQSPRLSMGIKAIPESSVTFQNIRQHSLSLGQGASFELAGAISSFFMD
jgi:hypothetical protein